MKISLERAEVILDDCRGIVCNGLMYYPDIYMDDANPFMTIKSYDQWKDCLISFNRNDNDVVEVINERMVLIDTSGTRRELTPLFEKQLI